MIKAGSYSLEQRPDGSAVLTASGQVYTITSEMIEAGLMVLQYLARAGTIETSEYLLVQESPNGDAILTDRRGIRVRIIDQALLSEGLETMDFLSDKSGDAKIIHVPSAMASAVKDDDPWPRPPWMCSDD